MKFRQTARCLGQTKIQIFYKKKETIEGMQFILRIVAMIRFEIMVNC